MYGCIRPEDTGFDDVVDLFNRRVLESPLFTDDLYRIEYTTNLYEVPDDSDELGIVTDSSVTFHFRDEADYRDSEIEELRDSPRISTPPFYGTLNEGSADSEFRG